MHNLQCLWRNPTSIASMPSVNMEPHVWSDLTDMTASALLSTLDLIVEVSSPVFLRQFL